MRNTSKTPVENTHLREENSSLITHISSLESENISLHSENTSLHSENTSIKQENLELKAIATYYEEQFKLMQKRKFTASSEKTDKDQLSMFDDVLNEAESQSDIKAPEPQTEESTYTRRKKRTKEELIANLPVEEVHYELQEDELICEKCAHLLHDMGTNSRDEVEIMPPKAILKKHIIHKYSCRHCEKTDINVKIISADAPKPLIKGSMATPSALSHIMTQKYMNAVPLYRQEKYMKSLGINLSRQTMSNWIIKSSTYLEYIYERMKEILLNQDIIHADETPVQVLKEKDRTAKQKSYMWLYKSGKFDNKIVLYDYQTSRSYENPKKFLADFEGFLNTDGYAAYSKLKSITQVGCLAHVRRKFKDAMELLPKEYHKESLAGIGFTYCNKLYKIEKQIKGLSLEERNEKRSKISAPLFEEFQKWVKVQILNSLPKSAYGKAMTYANNQLPKVKNYLLDPRLDIDNNSAERSIKPFVIGRKNWLFSNTAKGAKASALIYSIVETAKENNLRVHEYLNFILSELKDMDEYLDDDLDRLMPWSVDLPDGCRVLR